MYAFILFIYFLVCCFKSITNILHCILNSCIYLLYATAAFIKRKLSNFELVDRILWLPDGFYAGKKIKWPMNYTPLEMSQNFISQSISQKSSFRNLIFTRRQILSPIKWVLNVLCFLVASYIIMYNAVLSRKLPLMVLSWIIQH